MLLSRAQKSYQLCYAHNYCKYATVYIQFIPFYISIMHFKLLILPMYHAQYYAYEINCASFYIKCTVTISQGVL